MRYYIANIFHLMRTKQLLHLFSILLISCNNNHVIPDVKFDHLYGIKAVKVSKKENTLVIELFDKSYIYFEDYNDLKFDVLIHANYELLKDFEFIQVTSIQKAKGIIYDKTFTKEEVSNINNEFLNLHLKHNLYLLVNSFGVSEIWNFRSTALQFSDYLKDSEKLDYITLLKRHSELQNKERKDSLATERIIIMKDFFKEEGMEDAWSKEKQRIDASNLVLNLNLILKN